MNIPEAEQERKTRSMGTVIFHTWFKKKTSSCQSAHQLTKCGPLLQPFLTVAVFPTFRLYFPTDGRDCTGTVFPEVPEVWEQETCFPAVCLLLLFPV